MQKKSGKNIASFCLACVHGVVAINCSWSTEIQLQAFSFRWRETPKFLIHFGPSNGRLRRRTKFTNFCVRLTHSSECQIDTSPFAWMPFSSFHTLCASYEHSSRLWREEKTAADVAFTIHIKHDPTILRVILLVDTIVVVRIRMPYASWMLPLLAHVWKGLWFNNTTSTTHYTHTHRLI